MTATTAPKAERKRQAYDLLSALHPGGSIFGLSTFEPKTQSVFCNDPKKGAAEAMRLDRPARIRGVYHSMGNFWERPAAGRGKAEDVRDLRACWVDMDAADFSPLAERRAELKAAAEGAGRKVKTKETKEQAWREASEEERSAAVEAAHLALCLAPVRPSVIVFSGRGWHAIWLLDAPAEGDALDLVEAVNGALAEKLGGDCCGDRARVLRVAGTHNRKDPRSPLLAELWAFQPQRRYGLAELANAIEVDPTQASKAAPQKRARAGGRAALPPMVPPRESWFRYLERSDRARATWHGVGFDDRSCAAMSIANRAVRSGEATTVGEVLGILDNAPACGAWVKEKPSAAIDTAEKALAENPVGCKEQPMPRQEDNAIISRKPRAGRNQPANEPKDSPKPGPQPDVLGQVGKLELDVYSGDDGGQVLDRTGRELRLTDCVECFDRPEESNFGWVVATMADNRARVYFEFSKDGELRGMRKAIRGEDLEFSSGPDAGDREGCYSERGGCIYWRRGSGEKTKESKVCTFLARITEMQTIDDGAETRTQLLMEATASGRTVTFELTPPDFHSMSWPLAQLGPAARVMPWGGALMRSRDAIQELSGDAPRRQIFAHTGWRELEPGRWVYLHAGGAVGAEGAVPDVSVQLEGSLDRFQLPVPPDGAALADAVRASLRLLEGVPARLAFPLLAAVYRAPLGPTDFSLYLEGRSGGFKSELSALCQQHYGAGMDRQHLPASWGSTANSNREQLFVAKDALLVIDDMCPTGSRHDVDRMHRDADTIFRGQGNGAGRQRMRTDGTLRAARPPRGSILASGETIPNGHSCRARLLILEVEPGDIDTQWLSARQKEAGAGLYAQALAGFVRWVAPQAGQLSSTVPAAVRELRSDFPEAAHARHATTAAELLAGFEHFARFAEAAGAITTEQAAELNRRARAAILEAAHSQGEFTADADPVDIFLDRLGALFVTRKAHVVDRNGRRPIDPEAWGWSRDVGGHGERFTAGGDKIGWLLETELVLHPQAAFQAVQRLGDTGDSGILVGLSTLKKRLRERGILVVEGEGRQVRYNVQRRVEGNKVRSLTLFRAMLPFGEQADG